MAHPKATIAALTAASFVLGIMVAKATPGPLLSADDIAYLSLARTLALEGSAPIGPQAPYGVLYPTLLAPGWAFGLDEASMLGYARILNALFGALLLPTLFALVRQVMRISFRTALVCAVIGSSLPALWLTATMAWTERLLAMVTALALLTLVRLWNAPSFGRALAVVASGVALLAAHPRTGPAAVVVIAGAWLLNSDAGHLRRLAAPTLGVIGLGLVHWVRRALASAAFGSVGTYDLTTLAERRGLNSVPEMVQLAGGTIAYLTLAGTGLVVLAVFALLRHRPFGLVALGVLVTTIAVAAWFLTGVARADAYLHGRYVEVLAPVLVTFGAAVVPRVHYRAGLATMVAGPVMAGLYAAWSGPGDTWMRPRAPVMMLGVEPAGAPFGSDIFEPGAAAAVSVVVGVAVFVGLRSRHSAKVPVVVVAIAAVAVLSGLETLNQLHEAAVIGRIEAADVDLEAVEELYVDSSRVHSELKLAMAWKVGLDRTTLERSARSTHLLLGSGDVPPQGAQLLLELSEGTLWRVEPDS